MHVFFRYCARVCLGLWLFLAAPCSLCAGTQTYVVQAGDSLWEIADRFDVSINDLKQFNDLRSNRIYEGQKLRVHAAPPNPNLPYVVKKGDSLSEIAEQFDLSVAELKRFNGLRSNRIYEGQTLRMRAASDHSNLQYVVKRGDSLSEIAEQFGLSVAELKRLNALRSNRIYEGQTLRVHLQIPEIPAENGPYYFYKPIAAAQLSRNYREPPRFSPMDDYRKAQALLAMFDADIDAHLATYRHQHQPLKGWKIVIDPGHGGNDPGAIVSNTDGIDRAVYVVEDEYVYDIALRLYKKLRYRGADVEMTVISPNHLIRENLRATVTFVHEQNEVYNDVAINRKNAQWVRPLLDNIDERVRIANRFFKGTRRAHTLFISLHADNSPNRPKGPLVIYWGHRGKIDSRSRLFAHTMQKALDAPGLSAQIQGRNLAVLRGNSAYAEVLVEIRNISDKGEAWALRFHKQRDEDADRIFKGILDFAKRR